MNLEEAKRKAQEVKDGIQADGGKPEEQASPEDGSTAPQNGFDLDITKEYTLPNGAKMLGADVLNAIGRAHQVSEMQSNLHKEQARVKELEPSVQQAADLQVKLDEIAERQRMEDFYREKAPASPDVPEGSQSEWLTENGEKPTAPQMNPEEIARIVQLQSKEVSKETAQAALGNVEEIVQAAVQKAMEDNEAERVKQQSMERFTASSQQARIQDAKERYGMDGEQAKQLTDLQDASAAFALEAQQKFLAGDTQAAGEAWQQSRNLEQVAVGELAKSLVRHEAAVREQELSEQVLSGTFPVLPEKPEEPKVAKKPADVEKAQNDRMEQAYATAEAMAKMNTR